MKSLEELRTQEKLKAISQLQEISEGLKTASTTQTNYGVKSGFTDSEAGSLIAKKEELEKILKDKEYLDYIIQNKSLNYRKDPIQKEYFGIEENDNTTTQEMVSGEIGKQIEEERKKENQSGKAL